MERKKQPRKTNEVDFQTRPCPICGTPVSGSLRKCPKDNTLVFKKFEEGVLLDGKFQCIDVLGEGGMGVVYKARQVILNKVVAVKMLHPHLMNQKSLKRFQQEGRTGSQLAHRNIVQVYDFAVSAFAEPYLVMDLVRGQSLAEKLQDEGVLPLDFALWAFIEVCDALIHAHMRGVLHRDLKPSNVLVTNDQEIKIMDFGIAKIVDADGSSESRLTQTGEMVGSPAYMSPEQGLGKALDHRSDLYSLGCMMFECLTHTPPFVGGSATATIMQHISDPPPTLKQASLGRVYPEALEEIVSRLLSKDPNDRLQSAAQLQDELRSVRESLRSDKPAVVSIEPLTPKPDKRIPLLIASTVFLAIALALTAYMMLSQKSPPATTTKAEEKTEEAVDLTPIDTSDKAVHKELLTWVNDNSSATDCNFADWNLTDQDLSALSKLRACSVLDLHQNNSIKGWGLKYIEDLPLGSIRLDNTSIDDESLSHLGKIKTLHAINIKNNTKLTGSGLKYLANLKIISIDLDCTNVDSEGVINLKGIPQCSTVQLAGTRVDDSGMKVLASLPMLVALDLSGTKVTDIGVKELARAKDLKLLYLSVHELTDASIPYLCQLPNLVELDISATQITSKGIKQLASQSKNLRILYCGSLDSDAGLAIAELQREGKIQIRSRRKQATDTWKEYLKDAF